MPSFLLHYSYILQHFPYCYSCEPLWTSETLVQTAISQPVFFRQEVPAPFAEVASNPPGAEQ